ncbi:Cytochrome c-type biogenesis protein DsbD, protein-disulfide reductase [Vibrio chagasii]|nr:Cytochrome c-type biogenesis protein DsbD, protein-disulfide reductase [Vibrio chagasii]
MILISALSTASLLSLPLAAYSDGIITELPKAHNAAISTISARTINLPLRHEDAFKLDYFQSGDELLVSWKIKTDYKIYKNSISYNFEGSAPLDVDMPQGTPHFDEFFGDREVYESEVQMVVNLSEDDKGKSLTVKYQGCTEGFCYPPITQKIELN